MGRVIHFVEFGSVQACQDDSSIVSPPLGSSLIVAVYNKTKKTGGIAHIPVPVNWNVNLQDGIHIVHPLQTLLSLLKEICNLNECEFFFACGESNFFSQSADEFVSALQEDAKKHIFYILKNNQINLDFSGINWIKCEICVLRLSDGLFYKTTPDEINTLNIHEQQKAA